MKQIDLASSCARTPSGVGRIPSHLLGAALVVALAATSCAFAYEGKYDWHQGWREARVVMTGDAPALGGRRFSDCRHRAETDQIASGQFAVLSYEDMGHLRHRVVPLHAGEAYRPGDLVYMNVNSCDTPIVMRGRTVQKFPS
ncbi:MAG TPA: hypothetical protein VN649_03420 [Ramlibacter sp.]|nr:hypothetical protein [Ramlibacter sp.]